MAEKKESQQVLYGLKQVAGVLGLPEWRVKNFTDGDAYGLPKPLRVGSGRGSRKLYNVNDIMRLSIASKLVKCGFTPEAVGEGVQQIPGYMLALNPDDVEALETDRPVLMFLEGAWKLEKVSKANKLLEWYLSNESEKHGIFVLDFLTLVEGHTTTWNTSRRRCRQRSRWAEANASVNLQNVVESLYRFVLSGTHIQESNKPVQYLFFALHKQLHTQAQQCPKTAK